MKRILKSASSEPGSPRDCRSIKFSEFIDVISESEYDDAYYGRGCVEHLPDFGPRTPPEKDGEARDYDNFSAPAIRIRSKTQAHMSKDDFLKLADAAAILKAKLLRDSVCEALDMPNEDENTTDQWPSVAVDGKFFVLDQVRSDNQLYDKEFVADAFDRVCRLEKSGASALNAIAVPDST